MEVAQQMPNSNQVLETYFEALAQLSKPQPFEKVVCRMPNLDQIVGYN